LETVANQAFHDCFQVKHPEIYKAKHTSSPKQEISQNLLYSVRGRSFSWSDKKL